jgi:hypothetical protein
MTALMVGLGVVSLTNGARQAGAARQLERLLTAQD